MRQDVNYIQHHKKVNLKICELNLNPTHIALYNALFLIWNECGFDTELSINRNDVMKLSKIGSANTYTKCLKELDKHKLIKYKPSYNPLIGSKIEIYRFDKGCDKATDKGSVKSSSKGCDNSSDTLSKPLNKQTERETTDKTLHSLKFQNLQLLTKQQIQTLAPTPQKEKPINQLSKEEKEAIEYRKQLKREQEQAKKVKELNNEAPPDWKPEHAKDKYADQQDPNPRDLSYYDFAKEYAPAKHEQLIMRYSKRIKDSDTFIRKFNNKCIKKDVEFNTKKILAELEDYALNWLSFAKKFDNNNQQKTPKQL